MVISPPVASLQPKVSSLHNRSHLAPYKSYFPSDKSYFSSYKSYFPSYKSYFPSYKSYFPSYKSYFPSYKSYFVPCKKLVKYCHELFVLILELDWFWTYVSSDLLTNAVSEMTGGKMIIGWSDWIPLWPTTVYTPTATWNLFVLQNKEEKFCWWWCHLHIGLPLDHRQ